MTKAVIGVVLILLGIGSCIGTPMFLLSGQSSTEVARELTDALAQDLHVFEPGESPVVEVAEPGRYLLYVVTDSTPPDEGVESGPAPTGDFRFVRADGASVVAEDTDAFWLEQQGMSMSSVCAASLQPGRWTVEVPENASSLRLAVGRFEVPESFRHMLIGGGVGLFLCLVGGVLIVIGLAGRRRPDEG